MSKTYSKKELNEMYMKGATAAKWMPRKGAMAAKLRKAFGMSPKQYRKTLVSLTNVVESLMCAKDWDSIEFKKIPSLAMARYRKAFQRNAENHFDTYVNALVKGETTINASDAVYPYDVIKSLLTGFSGWGSRQANLTANELKMIQAQWDAMPDYMNDENVLSVVDVSGSMSCRVGGDRNNSLTCLHVALSMGLYTSDKSKGAFKDVFMTFSANPQIVNVKGSMHDKLNQMSTSEWGMNTNISRLFSNVLSHAKEFDVPASDMPSKIVVYSDMQFDHCCRYDGTIYDNAKAQFEEAGYELPTIIFWNINASDNAPVSYDTKGVALVSGYSPAMFMSLLGRNDITPESIMLDTVMKDRYSYETVYADTSA